MNSQKADAGFDVIAVSADSREKAQVDVAEFGWTFPAARPDLAELLDGMIFTIDNDRPARGMVV